MFDVLLDVLLPPSPADDAALVLPASADADGADKDKSAKSLEQSVLCRIGTTLRIPAAPASADLFPTRRAKAKNINSTAAATATTTTTDLVKIASPTLAAATSAMRATKEDKKRKRSTITDKKIISNDISMNMTTRARKQAGPPPPPPRGERAITDHLVTGGYFFRTLFVYRRVMSSPSLFPRRARGQAEENPRRTMTSLRG